MKDDKFINSFIEDAEKVSPQNANTYFIRGNKSGNGHVTHPKATWVDNIWSEDFKAILNSITGKDKLIVHWYDLEIGKLMLTVRPGIRLWVALWGGDFYGDPFLFKTKWLFDPLTWKFVKAHYHTSFKWTLRPGRLWLRLKHLYQQHTEDKELLALKQKTVERIDSLLLYPGSEAERNLVKQLYKTDLPFLPFLYNQNFDLANAIREDADKENGGDLIIQLGNSAAETNNHLDFFKQLQKYHNNNFRLIVQLAYGSPMHKEYLLAEGSKLFGEKFIAILQFLNREDYIKSLRQTDVAVMYHNRNQAFGNCIALLTLGKKLYMKPINPLYDLFKKSGLVVFDVGTISYLSFEEFSKPLIPAEVKNNVDKIAGLFSEKRRLEYLSKILN